MKKSLVCIFASIIGALWITPSMHFIQAEANSAQRHWEGVSATGAMITDATCPIVVKHEKLIFDLQEFPQNYYSSKQEFLSYNAKVTAEYTFYNPADYTVKATLAFPFGKFPYYVNMYDSETGDENLDVDTEKYEITLNGEPVEREIRYTLGGYFDEFDVSKDLPQLRDEYVEDEFYTPLTMVTRYVYVAEGIDENIRSAYASCIYNGDASKNRIWVVSTGLKEKDEGGAIGKWLSNGAPIEVYVIGEPLQEDLEWKLYEDAGQKKVISGRMVNSGKVETMTFEEFVYTSYFGEYQRQGEISQLDWYNAVVHSLNECLNEEYGIITYSHMNAQREFMRWYQYEIEIPPKSTVINAVTAPMYPSINTDYEPAIYGYTYLLSPAKTWKEFGALDIEIHTPYYLVDDKFGFTKTEDGYALSLDGLPEGELKFTLSLSEKPKDQRPARTCGYMLIYAILIPLSCIGGGLEAVGCISVVTSCGVFGSIFITMAVLLMKKRK